MLVLRDRAVDPGQVGNQVARLVPDGEDHLHQVDIQLEGGHWLGLERRPSAMLTGGAPSERASRAKTGTAPAGRAKKRQFPIDVTSWSGRRNWNSMESILKKFCAGRNLRGSGASDTLTIGVLCQWTVIRDQLPRPGSRLALSTGHGPAGTPDS